MNTFTVASNFSVLTLEEKISLPSLRVWMELAAVKVRVFVWEASIQKLNTLDMVQRKSPQMAFSHKYGRCAFKVMNKYLNC